MMISAQQSQNVNATITSSQSPFWRLSQQTPNGKLEDNLQICQTNQHRLCKEVYASAFYEKTMSMQPQLNKAKYKQQRLPNIHIL